MLSKALIPYPGDAIIPKTLNKKVILEQNDRTKLLGLVGKLSNSEVKQLIHEVLTPIGYNLMVTPKEVDYVIEKIGLLIGNGINKSLHKSFDSTK